jgi:hypothetical protein
MDINGLTLLPPDPVEWDTAIQAATKGAEKSNFKLAPKGTYTLLRKGPAEAGSTKEGYLQFTFPALTIQDEGSYHGQEIRFTKVNTKRWPDRPSSSLADYLLSAGYTGGARTNEEYATILEGLVAYPVKARCNWRSYCNPNKGGCGHAINGQQDFPTDAAGESLSVFPCPKCGNKTFANLEVKAFILA